MTTYPGRVKWAIRRHDVGPEPEIVVIEGNDNNAEDMARSMVRFMNETISRNGWTDVTPPELLRSQTQWEVVSQQEDSADLS